jgi:hypothetical protein
MPWKDQLRLAGRGLRWFFWPAHQKAWANVVMWVLWATMTVAIADQLWLPLLAALVVSGATQWLGRK